MTETDPVYPEMASFLTKQYQELLPDVRLHALVKKILFRIVHYFSAVHGCLILLDESGNPSDSVILQTPDKSENQNSSLINLSSRTLADAIVQTRQPVLADHTYMNEISAAAGSQERGIGSLNSGCVLGVPLMISDRCLGAIVLYHPENGFFAEDHLLQLQAISSNIALTLSNKQLSGKVTQHTAMIGTLGSRIASMNSSEKPDQFFENVLKELAKGMTVATTALGFFIKNDEVVIRYAAGLEVEKILGIHLSLSQDFVDQLMIAQQAFLLPVESGEMHLPLSGGEQMIACSPITGRAGLNGILLAITPDQGVYSASDLAVLGTTGQVIQSRIHIAELVDNRGNLKSLLQYLLELYPDPVLITSPRGMIENANQAALALLQKSANLLYGQNILTQLNSQLNLPEDLASIPVNTLHEFEAKIILSDKKFRQTKGKVMRSRLYTREKLVWLIAEEDSASSVVKDQWLAMIYHDLRAPLTNIISSLDMLSSEGITSANEAQTQLLNLAISSAGRMERLLKELLDISRLKAGASPVSEKQVDLQTFITETHNLLAPVLLQNNHRLAVKMTDLPSEWTFDSGMIQRVIFNLVENAMKYAPESPDIILGGDLMDNQLHFWVKDAGPGIKPEDQARIFGMYDQTSLSSVKNGLGIGLAFCRLALIAHGGKIWVESSLGAGSIFHILLPKLP